MSAYQYQALKQSGSTCKGVLEADSERHARQQLRDQGLIPTAITLVKKSNHIKQSSKFTAQDLSLFTRQLATLIAAGIPIDEALQGVGGQTDKAKARQLIISVRAKVLEGYSLAQAMAEFPATFPELYRATVAAGEQTGRLDIILEKLADFTENQQQTKQKIQQALIYPALMIIVSIAIIGFLMTFVVPKIIEVFSSSEQTLPIMTAVLIHISHFTKSWGLYVFAVLLLSLFLFKRALKIPKFLIYWHQFLLKMPFLSFLVKSVNLARYIHTFSILFNAGVSVLQTMRVASSVVSNRVMRAQLDIAANQVKEGSSIHNALKQTHLFGSMAIHLIASGEKSGELATMMERAATHLDREVQRVIDTLLTLLEPIIILLMGAVVLFIVLATLLPIFSMQQLVA